MARSRKTADLAGLVTRVNRALTDAADHQDTTMGVEAAKAFRHGMATVLEDALMASGAYKGFRFTDPTAKRTDEGYLIDGTYDETRRAYFFNA